MTPETPLLTAADFDFHLPADRIALRPASPRDAARLLVVQPGAAEPCLDRSFGDLISFLGAGDVLVFNDTRVMPARLHGRRQRGGSAVNVEALLTRREGADQWQAMARPAKRLRAGDLITFGGALTGAPCGDAALHAVVASDPADGLVTLRFELSGPALDAAIHLHGELPLPPYIAGKRAADNADKRDYQTVYAREEGAIAAPTAGLHFTPEILQRLAAKGVIAVFVTLHVGAGTFLPVKAATLAGHRMHAEWGSISPEAAAAINAARSSGGRIAAAGTTVLRLLESAAAPDGRVAAFSGETAIFITPGHRFRAVDLLLTNFHLPRSTLFMLVAAFSGLDAMKKAYAHAISAGYRFYSYGDASLLFPSDETAPDPCR